MRWSRVPFGKYKGKTFPEIIVRDPDWFFWELPNLYGTLAEEAQELARRARAIKTPRRGRRRLEVEYEFDMDRRFNGFEFVDADSPPSRWSIRLPYLDLWRPLRRKYDKRAGRIMLRDFRRRYFGEHKRLTKERCEEFLAMIETLSTFRAPPLLSPRTANYLAALTREGDNFDYYKWLQAAREEEAQANLGSAGCPQSELVATEMADQVGKADRPGRWQNSALMSGEARIPKALWQLRRASKTRRPEIRSEQQLEKILAAWEDFQGSRVRDAVYGYLTAVFETVMHYKVRRKTNKLLRQAFKFADLPFANGAEPFAAVIRCTCDYSADNKTISKWARALRYVAHCKEPSNQLKTFMKEAGGVNACADLYAKCCGRGAR